MLTYREAKLAEAMLEGMDRMLEDFEHRLGRRVPELHRAMLGVFMSRTELTAVMERGCRTLVDDAITAGLLAEQQRTWALGYAWRDYESFLAYIGMLPVADPVHYRDYLLTKDELSEFSKKGP